MIVNTKLNSLTNALINSKLYHPPSMQPPLASEILKISLFKFLPCGAKILFQCPAQVLDLMVNFSIKGEISNCDFLHIDQQFI